MDEDRKSAAWKLESRMKSLDTMITREYLEYDSPMRIHPYPVRAAIISAIGPEYCPVIDEYHTRFYYKPDGNSRNYSNHDLIPSNLVGVMGHDDAMTGYIVACVTNPPDERYTLPQPTRLFTTSKVREVAGMSLEKILLHVGTPIEYKGEG